MTWDSLLAFLMPGGVPVGAGVLALGVLAGVMPLRGSGGQHAGSGPGALNVWQLCAALEALESWDERGEEPESIAWPSEDAEASLAWFFASLPKRRPGAERMVEFGELWDEPLPQCGRRETEYVGRHRLVNPLEHLNLDIAFPRPERIRRDSERHDRAGSTERCRSFLGAECVHGGVLSRARSGALGCSGDRRVTGTHR